jgi:hypothetical protein
LKIHLISGKTSHAFCKNSRRKPVFNLSPCQIAVGFLHGDEKRRLDTAPAMQGMHEKAQRYGSPEAR